MRRRRTSAWTAPDVVVFLCSDLARYVAGVNIVVDGGSVLPSAQSDRFLARMLGDG